MEIQKSTNSALRTQAFAQTLAQKFLAQKNKRKNALVLGLEGELGAGKTTFAKGFAKGLGIQERITSPTFVILKKYEIRNTKYETDSKPQNTKYKYFYHVDAYRLQHPKELLALGWEKILANPRNIVLVEWADHVKRILPKTALRLVFEHAKKNARKIRVR